MGGVRGSARTVRKLMTTSKHSKTHRSVLRKAKYKSSLRHPFVLPFSHKRIVGMTDAECREPILGAFDESRKGSRP
jgi:hypothetical protein